MTCRVVIVDNYDSFTWNLAQALQVLGAEVVVFRNDEVSVEGVFAAGPTHLVVSPGPGRPEDAGITLEIVHGALGRLPLLGVCLGHQALAVALGGRVQAARALMHGKSSLVHHDGRGLFSGLPDPMAAGRYHSLAVDDLPPTLEACAWTADGEIMAMRHRSLPAVGLQFHPESVMTPQGDRLLANFLRG